MIQSAEDHATGTFEYVGDELETFAHAVHWKNYFQHSISEFIRGDVLEVGAGIGATTRALCTGSEDHWVCLEPDAQLAEQLVKSASADPMPVEPEVVIGCVSDLPAERSFDAILYIDVLEHIEDDAGELARAAEHLNPGGHLIVLSPAHQMAFSEYDAAIGHYRRYNKSMLRAVEPNGLRRVRLFHLDSLGLMLSLANRFVLRSDDPKPSQIKFWDRWVVPCSRVLDPLVGRSFGRSIVGVWQKP
ncbi:MAG: class I SAM-dependent methyltransferase [Pirellulales bacterium]|nr:class I SAM-dependent methyltransferase [Pirellulales bacterium]